MLRPLNLLLAAALWLAPLATAAHEIGNTTVRLTLQRDHRWIAFIVTAPQTLANKLELEAGEPRSSGLTEKQLREAIERHLPALVRHIDVRFDDKPSPASVTVSDLQSPDDVTVPAFVELRATGTVPAGSRSVSWHYDLIYATYALYLADGDDAEPQLHWLQGDIASRAFPIGAPK